MSIRGNRYKVQKYRNKIKRLNKQLEDDNGCEFIKFPPWVGDMSKKYKDAVDYTKLTITPSSVYSSELPFHIPGWKKLLEHVMGDGGNKFSMLDMTANIGGLSINMANLFSQLRVTAVEMDRCNYRALVKNINSLNLQDRVKPELGDSLKYLEECLITNTKFDLVVIDPPWGGRGYKKKKRADLRLGHQDIHETINSIFENGISGTVLLKAPTNFKYRFKKKYYTKRIKFKKPSGAVSYYVFLIKDKPPKQPKQQQQQLLN